MNYRDDQEAKTFSRVKDIKHLLIDIKEILNTKLDKIINMNATKNKPVEDQLHEIKHILKVLLKGQEEIKSHL
jgi:hypothetical protein